MSDEANFKWSITDVCLSLIWQYLQFVVSQECCSETPETDGARYAFEYPLNVLKYSSDFCFF